MVVVVLVAGAHRGHILPHRVHIVLLVPLLSLASARFALDHPDPHHPGPHLWLIFLGQWPWQEEKNKWYAKADTF